MHRFTPIAVLALVAVACGSDTAPETSPATQPPATQAPDTQPPETEPPTTEPPAGTFAISEVVFGRGGGVAVRNIGDAAASVGGMAVCQRPNYTTLPDVIVQPGEVIWLVTGDPAEISFDPGQAPVERIGTGTFSASSGEIGLYSRPSFGSSDFIRSYVEWGGSGHGRSSVAVGAGIWPDGGTVDVPDGTVRIVATADPAVAPADWTAEA
ncbi:MAG: hypothetical protein ACE5MI_06100 [Acidimicrobiia bacterium]